MGEGRIALTFLWLLGLILEGGKSGLLNWHLRRFVESLKS